jgi:Ca-activated chloride channel family protein
MTPYISPLITGRETVISRCIKERQQARAIYEQAKQNGQKAALTEQERPNIFTNSVANIGPGETVLVQIEYQEPVHKSDDVFSLRIPMVVGPRYNPAPVVQTVDLRTGDNGWGIATSDPVPDRDRISPPVLDPKDHAPVNPTTISIRLQAGFPLGEVKSHFHNVKIDSPDSSTRVITLADGAVPADRDFELTWTAAAEKTPSFGVFREQDLTQAKAFVTALQAQGGTVMIPPMRAALTDHHADGNTLRQVVFPTDGCIGNEQQLFDTITSMRGRSRVFMVGIGSAPN